MEKLLVGNVQQLARHPDRLLHTTKEALHVTRAVIRYDFELLGSYRDVAQDDNEALNLCLNTANRYIVKELV